MDKAVDSIMLIFVVIAAIGFSAQMGLLVIEAKKPKQQVCYIQQPDGTLVPVRGNK